MTMTLRMTSAVGGVRQRAEKRRWPARLIAPLRRWLGTYRRWRAERAAMAQLQAMSDRALNDIGISRSEIGTAVREEAARQALYHRFH